MARRNGEPLHPPHNFPLNDIPRPAIDRQNVPPPLTIPQTNALPHPNGTVYPTPPMTGPDRDPQPISRQHYESQPSSAAANSSRSTIQLSGPLTYNPSIPSPAGHSPSSHEHMATTPHAPPHIGHPHNPYSSSIYVHPSMAEGAPSLSYAPPLFPVTPHQLYSYTSPYSVTTLGYTPHYPSIHNNSVPRIPRSGVHRKNKSHVARACANCKKAHLSCDTSRPCARCVSTRKEVRDYGRNFREID